MIEVVKGRSLQRCFDIMCNPKAWEYLQIVRWEMSTDLGEARNETL